MKIRSTQNKGNWVYFENFYWVFLKTTILDLNQLRFSAIDWKNKFLVFERKPFKCSKLMKILERALDLMAQTETGNDYKDASLDPPITFSHSLFSADWSHIIYNAFFIVPVSPLQFSEHIWQTKSCHTYKLHK